jgi:hypothetical protein
MVSTVLFVAISAGIAIHCYTHSMFDIDLLGYSGSVAFIETGDIEKAHKIVYSAPLTPHLLGLDDSGKQAMDMRERAADPYHAAMLLPYFAIKPLYIITLTAAHRLGFSVIDSSRFISALFYFGIAVLLWLYTRSWLSLLALIMPEIILLGQANEPDSMSAFFVLFGLWLVFMKHRDMGLLVLVLSVWVRPENALVGLLAIVVLMVDGRLDVYKALTLALLCIGSELLINHYGYGWQELYHHLIGGEPGTGSALRFPDYGHTLFKGVHDMLHSSAPLFGLVWLVCFPKVTPDFRRVMGIVLVFSIARFLVFPPYEPRYYGPFFLTSLIALLLVIKDGSYRRLVEEQLRRFPRISSAPR